MSALPEPPFADEDPAGAASGTLLATARGGLERILWSENAVSDFLLLLSDLDMAPWNKHVGFTPTSVKREGATLSRKRADLVLRFEPSTAGQTSSSKPKQAVIEAKVGHHMDDAQRINYETFCRAQGAGTDMYLAVLTMDLAECPAPSVPPAADEVVWHPLVLADVARSWEESSNPVARALATGASAVLERWDRELAAVFNPDSGGVAKPLGSLEESFVRKVAGRQIARLIANSAVGVSADSRSGEGGALKIHATAADAAGRTWKAYLDWATGSSKAYLRVGQLHPDQVVDGKPQPKKLTKSQLASARVSLAPARAEGFCARLEAALNAEGLDIIKACTGNKHSNPDDPNGSNCLKSGDQLYEPNKGHPHVRISVDLGKASGPQAIDLLITALRTAGAIVTA